ncbi:hypothetical protein [Actinacidiphila oryziradicis]|uniref:hypothetical protein n=1 Tax=Actinacidiphila oryziradicis TaxID=2571141 RepID=UPI00145E5698|nr:hypothetical protein [Actinacidiphila oryziradicis]
MKNKPNPHPPDENKQTDQLRQWFARRRHIIAANVLRGACYGIGTGAVGFGFWWIEHRP